MPAKKRRSLLRDLTPPIIARLVRPAKPETVKQKPRAVRHVPTFIAAGRERDAAFYDETFHRADDYLEDYTQSHYYPIWTVLADRITRAGVTSIVDLGCGPGQLAALIRDKGIPRYLGVDFSAARIEQARKACPEYEFLTVDIFKSDVLTARDYDAVVATEFLEHINEDLEVLDTIRPGTHVFATVPNFGSSDHVRLFETVAAVKERYGSRFQDLDVQSLRADTQGRTFYILDGIKR